MYLKFEMSKTKIYATPASKTKQKNSISPIVTHLSITTSHPVAHAQILGISFISSLSVMCLYPNPK